MRIQFSKIVLAAFAVSSALSTAFAAGIPGNCAEEIITLSKSNGFDMQAFTTNLLFAVAKAKLQARDILKPKDSDKTDIGITFGCLKAFPESPSEIASLLEDISLKTGSNAVAVAPSQVQPQYAQPQYVQPQAQPQVQYVYLPQQVPCPECPKCSPNRNQKIQKLIEDDIQENKKEIQNKSAYLSDEEIEDLYEKNKKKNAAGLAILGATVGLGVGSYVQGNIGAGVAQSLIDVLSYSLLITGDSDSAGTFGYFSLVASRLTGIIAPFVYQNNYNKALKDALQGDRFSYSIDPLIIPKDGTPAVGLAFNLRY